MPLRIDEYSSPVSFGGGLRVAAVKFRSHDGKNLLNTCVSGKKKAGAVFLSERDMVCTVTLSDGSSITLYACIRASVIEVNHNLIARPELLGSPEGCAPEAARRVRPSTTARRVCMRRA